MSGHPLPQTLLGRVVGDVRGGIGRLPSLFQTHPGGEERRARLEGGVQASGPPLLDETQWQALRGICKT